MVNSWDLRQLEGSVTVCFQLFDTVAKTKNQELNSLYRCTT